MKNTWMTAALSAFLSLSAQAQLLCQPKTDSFGVLLDVSGSMMQPQSEAPKSTNNKDKPLKISLAKDFLLKFSGDIDFSVQTALFTVGPFTVRQAYSKRDIQEFQQVVKAIPEDLETVGRMTWLGQKAQNFLNLNHKNATLLLITDGRFTHWKQEEKVSPKTAFEQFKQSDPNNRLYVLSLADNQEDKSRLESELGVSSIDLLSLMSNQDKYKTLRLEIFNKYCGILELKGINFEFDKDVITEDSAQILDDALKVIKSHPASEKFKITGWTDIMGGDAYNKDLAKRRAQAVRTYFVKHGIGAERMLVEGKGKSFKYDNATEQGRFENRRVNIEFLGN